MRNFEELSVAAVEKAFKDDEVRKEPMFLLAVALVHALNNIADAIRRK